MNGVGGSHASRPGAIDDFRGHEGKRRPRRLAMFFGRRGARAVIAAGAERTLARCRRPTNDEQAPLRLIEYVVAHEIVHVLHADHGRSFWAALGRVMPDYERRREDLRKVGSTFEW